MIGGVRTDNSPSLSNFSTSNVGLKGPKARALASVAVFRTEEVMKPVNMYVGFREKGV